MFREHLKVLDDLAPLLELGRLELCHLLADDLVHEIEVGGDPPGAVIFVFQTNGRVRLAVEVRVMLPHPLNENVVDDGNHRGNAKARHPQGCVDGECQPENGNVKRMNALILHVPRSIC